MAFFKFRFPGQAAADAVADKAASGPGENIDSVRRRARHRLIGSVVLVLLAVVGFPLLFDTQPRPVSVDTPILIPDRQTVQPLANGAPVKLPAEPLSADARPLPAQAGLGAREELVPSETRPPQPKPVRPEAAGHVNPASKDESNKARSLLEDKKSSATTERIVIQVGAFNDPTKVREVRKKLEQAGLTTYTQIIEDKDGKSTTRVRVGPFENRDEADQVAGRVRKLGLSPAVLRI